MKVLTLTLGPLATNCYLVSQQGHSSAMLIDAPGDPQEVVRLARDRELKVCLIVTTHGHADHIEAAAALKRLTGADLAIHELDASMLADQRLSGATMFDVYHDGASADRLLREGDSVGLNGTAISLSVMHTPGHTPGSICLLGQSVLFSGDCLFAGGIGRVDLPGGDERAMMESLARLAALDLNLTVYPGHGPATTIGAERESNPWLQGR